MHHEHKDVRNITYVCKNKFQNLQGDTRYLSLIHLCSKTNFNILRKNVQARC